MRILVAILLIVWEPLNFATELLSVLSTISYRGWVAVVELVLHGMSAAISAMGGLALLNESADARRLATIALVVSFLRIVQSLYWSVLPNSTVPGEAPYRVVFAAVMTLAAIAVVRRSGR